MLWDMRPLEDVPPDALAEAVDVTDLSAVEAGRDRALAAAGRIDVLVNNAGIAGPTVPVEAYSPADWRRVMAVNLDGVFHCCRAVAPVMRRQGWGRIVNIASVAGKGARPTPPPTAPPKRR